MKKLKSKNSKNKITKIILKPKKSKNKITKGLVKNRKNPHYIFEIENILYLLNKRKIVLTKSNQFLTAGKLQIIELINQKDSMQIQITEDPDFLFNIARSKELPFDGTDELGMIYIDQEFNAPSNHFNNFKIFEFTPHDVNLDNDEILRIEHRIWDDIDGTRIFTIDLKSDAEIKIIEMENPYKLIKLK